MDKSYQTIYVINPGKINHLYHDAGHPVDVGLGSDELVGWPLLLLETQPGAWQGGRGSWCR